MKQGRATVDVNADRKVEPNSRAVSPGAVSQIGSALDGGRKELYEGRGYEAPKNSSTVHKGGSQGKH